jgi:hypothetical protein
MARAEGPVAGMADYLCRFCEVVVHARPDGREAVSYRIAGKRREFELVGDARLAFPLPGLKTPEEVLVAVDQAALNAASGAGHPVRLPGRPVGLPGHPVTLPGAPVNLPSHPVRLPAHPVSLPSHPVELPGKSVELPSHPVRLPSRPIALQGHPVRVPGAPVRLPGHAVGRPGHPMGLGGSIVVAPAGRPLPEVAEAQPAQQPRFFRREGAVPDALRRMVKRPARTSRG